MELESQIADEFHKTLTLEEEEKAHENDDNDDKDDNDDTVSSDFEFSFAGAGDAASSPVSAEDIFHNGQIRPTFPFNSDEATTSFGPPVRKLFVKSSPERDDIAEGPYCGWSSGNSKAPTPAMSKKSNSTGFSKLWRFRDLLVRSNSDGKDAFVFLTDMSPAMASKEKNKEKKREKVKVQRKKKEGETTTLREKKEKEKSVYEVLYGKREKEKKAGKGKSYLPYKVGFFTNVNGSMSRNVHPY